MGGWRDAAQDEEQDAQDEQQEDAQGQGQQQPRRVFPFSQARTASSGTAVGVGMVHRVGLVGAAKTETRQCNLMRGAKGTQVGKDCVAHDTPKLVGVADHCNDMRETSSVRVWSSDHGTRSNFHKAMGSSGVHEASNIRPCTLRTYAKP